MKLRNITLAGMILLVVAFAMAGAAGASQVNTASNSADQPDIMANTVEGTTGDGEELLDDIEEYDGSLGPENALYGLKIAFENLDETFTFNESEKLGKQVAHARQRIAEVKAELRKKDIEAANKALEKYKEKLDEADDAVSGANDADSGILHAQRMIVKHQYVLEKLLASNPNSTGLQRAYNNSLRLEQKFENKTAWKLERRLTKEGRKLLKEVRKEKDDDRDETDGDRGETEEKAEVKAKVIGNATQIDVQIKFVSNSTDNFTLAKEILNKFQMSNENIGALLEIEEEDGGKPEQELTAEADVKENLSRVKAEYKFPLNQTNRTELINGTYQVLSELTVQDILDILEIRADEDNEKIIEKEKRLEKQEREDIKEKEKKLEKEEREKVKEKEKNREE